MSDDADLAQERLEREEAARRKYQQPSVKKYYDDCRWCGDPTENGAGFCSKDCHLDWHRFNTTLKRLNIKHTED